MINNRNLAKERKITSLLTVILLFFYCIPSVKVNADTNNVSVTYIAHVQNEGWLRWVKNGVTSGTTGKGLRMEAIKVLVEGNKNLGVEYSAHVQDIGWQNYVKDGELGGTERKSKRVEAVKIRLTGNDKDKYDIYYRVHAESYGWLDWTKNDSPAGTAGLSKRLEAIQIKILKKGDNSIKTSSNAFVLGNVNVAYSSHVQHIGWQRYVCNGALSGTTGKGLRLEGIKITLTNNGVGGGISYSTQIQNIGWQGFKSNNQLSGTSGRSLRLESIKIKLTGDISNYYDVYYRVHAQNFGWLGWTKNGETSGTVGLSLRLEGIQIILVKKGNRAPGSVSGSYIYKGSYNSIIKNDDTRIINGRVYVNGVSSSIPIAYHTPYTYIDNLESDILATINNYRTRSGFNKLTINKNLNTIAKYKATAIMEYNKPGNTDEFLLNVANDRDGTDGNLIHKMGPDFNQYKYNISNTSFVVSSTYLPDIMNALQKNWMLTFKRMENVGICVCYGRGRYYISVYYTGKLLYPTY